MKVTLATHGGLAATINRGRRPRGVDGDSLSREEAQELARLVTTAEAEPAPEEGRGGYARDAMTYTITVEHGGRSIKLIRSDATMSQGFSDLRRWLEDHSRET